VLPAILALASVSSVAQALEYKASSLTITDPSLSQIRGSAHLKRVHRLEAASLSPTRVQRPIIFWVEPPLGLPGSRFT
jgi:hypothetical protein